MAAQPATAVYGPGAAEPEAEPEPEAVNHRTGADTPEPAATKVERGAAKPEARTRRATSGVRRGKDPSIRPQPELDAMRDALERALETMTSGLADRAREIDDRAAAHLRALEHERSSMPGELQRSIAEVLPGMVAEAVRTAIDARRPEPPSSVTLVDEVARSVAGVLPGMVTEAVEDVLWSHSVERPNGQAAGASTPDHADGFRPRAEHDPIIGARQRSMEKRLDGLTRRTREIDDRVSAHLRLIDDDRTMLSDVVRRHDQLAQAVADADVPGSHERLAALVAEVVPGMVAGAVEAALEAQAATLTASFDRVETARAEAEAVGETARESSERTMEALERRRQEVDERAAGHLRALEEERAALAVLLEGGREQVSQSVVAVLPTMVEDAVRTAMARYATERRSPMLEMASRLRADSDVMREGLQRSFEKMMESLAVREQELDDRAGAHVRAVQHERAELAGLRRQVADSLTDALPEMVATAVAAVDDRHRAELDEAREEIDRLRAENEAATAELRQALVGTTEALAGMREELAQRADAFERQAAASERALENLRSAMNRPAARNRGWAPVPSLVVGGASPADGGAPAGEPPAGETTVVETNGGRVLRGKPTVPRSRRVERRMLKIDDSDDGPRRPLDLRQAALSELLEGPDQRR